MGDSPDYRPETALFIEVAKQAANGRGTDVPRSIISHVLQKRNDKQAPITCEILVSILKDNSLPTPAEQANNLIIFLGEHLSSPGAVFTWGTSIWRSREYGTTIFIDEPDMYIYAILGIKTGKDEWNDFHFIITALEEQKILRVNKNVVALRTSAVEEGTRASSFKVSLTFVGWQKYEELRRSVKDSRKAFVAMDFANPEKREKNYFFQETLLDKYLVPAVKQTGYALANSLRSEPTAGNIHARMEVEIRAARFVIAELSHHNNGAYWEAGFARGLGKPVIYMYNRTIGSWPIPHFDVGSDHIIFWEQDKPEKAAEELKAVIRATLFGEAITED
jgi:nucleoside 2-deoxyribosyltransferase